MSSVKVWEGRRACPVEHSGRELQVRRSMFLVSCPRYNTTLHNSTLGNVSVTIPQGGPVVVVPHMQGTDASLGCKDTVESTPD